jgi:phosphoribosylamine-glycine ligase
VKPIRGRGSQGVSLAKDITQLHATIKYFFEERQYGNALYIEEFLSGEELTITIMRRSLSNWQCRNYKEYILEFATSQEI